MSDNYSFTRNKTITCRPAWQSLLIPCFTLTLQLESLGSEQDAVGDIFTSQHLNCSQHTTYNEPTNRVARTCGQTVLYLVRSARHSPWCGSENFEKRACGSWPSSRSGHGRPGAETMPRPRSIALRMPQPGDAAGPTEINWAAKLRGLLNDSWDHWNGGGCWHLPAMSLR